LLLPDREYFRKTYKEDNFTKIMVQLKLKGNELNCSFTTNSSSRYAILFRNKILTSLKKVGVSQDYIRLKEETTGMKKSGAEVRWYMKGFNCYYSYNRQENYVDNLQVISKLIDAEVNQILEEKKTVEEFIQEFNENDEVIEQRKKAREFLKLDENEKDMNVINIEYKKLAREFHPDMPNGNSEKFKKLNEIHKVLKKELE